MDVREALVDGVSYMLSDESNHTAMVSTWQFILSNDQVESVDIPSTIEIEGITYQVVGVSSHAFNGLIKLKEVNLPEGIIWIDPGMCERCYCLEKVNLPHTLKYLREESFKSCSSLKEIDIPDSVLYIGEEAFADCKVLEKVNIPDGVKEIQEYTFFGCTSLKEVYIPDSVEKIRDRAFIHCWNIENVSLPKNVQLGERVFEDSVKLNYR